MLAVGHTAHIHNLDSTQLHPFLGQPSNSLGLNHLAGDRQAAYRSSAVSDSRLT